MDQPVRYPDPAIQIVDPSFAKYRIGNAGVERLATGYALGEGPVWFGDGRYLLWSDIPNNRIMRWDEETGAVSVFRKPSNYSNGNTRDRQGRLVTCEHDTRRVTRTEYDGTITVIADRFEGKPLNSPNDVVVQIGRLDLVHRSAVRHPRQLRRARGATSSCRRTSTAWDPPDRAGRRWWPATSLGRTAWRSRPTSSKLYVVVSGAMPRVIRVFDVVDGGTQAGERPRVHRLRQRHARRLARATSTAISGAAGVAARGTTAWPSSIPTAS